MDTIEQTLETCADCGENIEETFSPEDARISPVDGQTYCYGCYEHETTYAGTIVYLSPENEEPVTYLISEHFGFDMQFGDDIDRNTFDVDAQGFPTVAGTEQVSDGTDLWGLETDIRDVAERLRDDHAQGLLPFDAYVTVKQTGNFAVYMAVHVAQADREAFNSWLNGDDYCGLCYQWADSIMAHDCPALEEDGE